MAAGATNRVRYNIADQFFRNAAPTANLWMALITNAVTAGVDTNTLTELTQIGDAGYTSGGLQVDYTTEFDSLTEGTGGGTSYVQITDQQWTATTSIAPAQIVLTNHNVTEGSREVLFFWDNSETATAGQTFTVTDAQIQFNYNSGQFTDRGMYTILNTIFEGATEPTNLYVALIRASSVPTADTVTLSELTQISTATGYTSGGISLNRNSTDFDSLVENDTSDQAELQIKDISWTASGGNLDSGAGARYAVLTDDNGTEGSREVFCWWDLAADRNVTDTNSLTLQNLQMNITI